MSTTQDLGGVPGLFALLALAGGASLGAAGCAGVSGTAVRVSDDVVAEDLMMAGSEVRVEADVKGDVAVAGAAVTISAPVEGYVMSAGRTVAMQGPIGNDLWAAGEQVRISNRVGNNAMAAGETVILEPNASIGRNARLFGATVRSEGRITGDLTIGAGRAEIGGNIGGAVRASADQVTVLPGAVVSGDLVVRSPDPPVVSPGAQVMGQVFHQRTDRGGAWPGWPLSWLGVFLALLLLGAAALAVSPDWSARVAETIRTRTLWSLVAGVIVLLAVPVVVALLLVTLIGIPLALVLAAAWVAALVLSAAFVSYRVGLWLLARAHRAGASRWGALALGALVVSLGMTLPAVGGIVALAVVLIGAGALVLERRVPVGA